MEGGCELTPSTPPVPKKQYDFIYKIPYVDEAFTRMVKKHLEEKKINARVQVVTVSGKTVESLYRAKRQNLCECLLCSSGVNCSTITKHAVYDAECVMPST